MEGILKTEVPHVETEVVAVDPDHIDPKKIGRAAEILKAGGLVAFPTETVYGLGGDALNPASSRKIYAAKGRPSDNPLIVHIADMEHLTAIAADVPENAEKLAAAYWPGPLTMIFPKRDIVPRETTGGLDTVAVRMPSHPVAAALIRAAGGFIAAPSANLSGRPSPSTAQHVIDDLAGRIDMVISSGWVDIGVESTIVDFTEDVPCVLRPGYINLRMLQDVLGEVRIDPGIINPDANQGVRPKAPGMRYRHYAPRADLTIIEGGRDAVVRKISELAGSAVSDGQKVGLLVSDETRERYRPLEEKAGSLPGSLDLKDTGSLADDITISRHLFAMLRAFDDDGVDVIYSESFDTPGLGMAVMNRLLKAAGHKVIRV